MPTRIICTVIVIFQCVILDYYLVSHKGYAWLAFILADLAVVFVFVAAFVISYRHLLMSRESSTQMTEVRPGSLPLGYIAWGVYSLALVARIVVIFRTFVFNLSESDFFGPNLLKLSLSLSSPIFLLLLMTHNNAPITSPRRQYIEEITGNVPLDILDSVEILDVLFTQQSRILLPFSLEHAILSVSCINLVLPVLPLLTLSRTHFGFKKLADGLLMGHRLLHMIVVNVPYLVIRLIIWHGAEQSVSVLLTKNIIMIFLTLHDLYAWKQEKQLEKEENARNYEMEERNSITDNQAL